MFIKLEQCSNKQTLILNGDSIEAITPQMSDGSEQGCNILMTSGRLYSVKEAVGTLENLLEVNSIEKIINRLKEETTRIRLQELHNETLEEFIERYNGRTI